MVGCRSAARVDIEPDRWTVMRDSTDGVHGGNDDSYAVNEAGVLTVTIANPRFTRQIYSPSGWLEVVVTNPGIDAGATRTVMGHKLRS